MSVLRVRAASTYLVGLSGSYAYRVNELSWQKAANMDNLNPKPAPT